MIRLRDMETHEVVEMDEATQVHLVDGLHYTETKQVKTIGALTTLRELRAFEMVQVNTGFDDDEGLRVMAILPKRKHGIAVFIASTLMALAMVGCGPATYSYTYTCYGQGCAPAPMPMYVSYYQPQQTQVQYVDRPMDIRVHQDVGSVVERRPAQPRIK